MKTSDYQFTPVRAGLITRLGRRLFCWQTVRRILVCFAVLATLLAALYAFENWRGKRAWENARCELEAKGEVLDWSAYIPPPVPDDQNMFKAPKMQEWFVKNPGPRYISTNLSLSSRLTNSATGSVGTANNVITNAMAAREYLAWSDGLTNEFNLIREALKRPYAIMDGDYQQPFEMPIPNFVTMRNLAQTLAQRAYCYLLLARPEEALRELTLIHDLRHLLEARPTGKPMTLVSAMINVAVTGLYVNQIAEGLRLQAWGETQLLTLQRQLEGIDLIAPVRMALKCEPAAVCHMMEAVSFSKLLSMGMVVSGTPRPKSLTDRLWDWVRGLKLRAFDLMPRGWIDQNMAVFFTLSQKPLDGFSVEGQLIEPVRVKKALKEFEAAMSRRSLFNLVANVAIPHSGKAIQTCARNQTLANQGAIACALERYRIANGNYPETLDVLVPQFIEKLPHDIVGGQPLKYQRTTDGKFLLYSIGWNETDDGGQVMRDKKGEVNVSSLDGDWVWPMTSR